MTVLERLPVVVLISGNGSNLQAILDACQAGTLPVEVRGVVSNVPDVYGLKRAHQAGVPAVVVSSRGRGNRLQYDQVLAACVEEYQPQLVVLAGFMRILSPPFVAHYQGRMLNIHPALLPAFRGLHTHERALTAGVQEHGASVHFVTDELDGGPVVVQARVPILVGDTPSQLAARVLLQEHRIYPLAISWFATKRLQLVDNQAYLDGQLLPVGGVQYTWEN